MIFEALGCDVEDYDICNGNDFDLADGTVWMPIREALLTVFHSAVFASPPCSIASRLRFIAAGPVPFCGVTGRWRYGLKGLSPEDR